MHNEKTKTRGKVMQTEKNTTFNMERKKAKKRRHSTEIKK